MAENSTTLEGGYYVYVCLLACILFTPQISQLLYSTTPVTPSAGRPPPACARLNAQRQYNFKLKSSELGSVAQPTNVLTVQAIRLVAIRVRFPICQPVLHVIPSLSTHVPVSLHSPVHSHKKPIKIY